MNDNDIIEIDPETGEVIEPGAAMTSEAEPPASGESATSRPDGSSLPAMVEPHTYRPQLVLAPDAAKALVDQVTAMQRSVLVQGTDYDVIPGTGGKPTLLKPGAERLLQVFGLGHRMEVLAYDEDGDGRKLGVTYRCTVTKTLADGNEITVSSCDGHASSEEPKWRRAPWNTIIKMAQKRALVGACLTATATSGLFTQDVEDGLDRGGSASPRGSADHDHEVTISDPDGAVTDKQVTMIQAMFTEQGIKSRDAKIDICKNAIGRHIESTKDLTKGEASKVITHLKGRAR